MQTLTEIVAAVVVHSSAFAYSHFGVALEPPHPAEQASPVERIVARTVAPRPAARIVERIQKAPARTSQRTPSLSASDDFI